MVDRYLLETGWQILFKDLDVSPQDVLYYARLPLDLLSRKSPTITGDEFFRLWNGLAQTLRHEPTFPLRLAQTITPEIFSPPIFACLCSRNLNIALQRITHYKPLVAPVHLKIEQNERHTVLVINSVSDLMVLPQSLIIFELAFWVQIARIATREHIIPLHVHTNMELPAIKAYEAFFGICPQRSDFNGIVFSDTTASKPFLTVNDSMWSIFEPELNKRLQSLNQEALFHERVRACLIEILASGEISIDDVSSRLAVSNRTLQRRLYEEGTSFQKVLDNLRRELALHYLTSTNYSSGQISFLLGYEETNSFYRSFRVWTGQTPENIRTGVVDTASSKAKKRLAPDTSHF